MNDDKFTFVLEKKLLNEINTLGKLLTFDRGQTIIKPQKYIKVVPLLLKGTVKVLREDGEGNELFLYHITAGQSCAVSLSTCLTDKISNIKAVAEDDVELVVVPSTDAVRWFQEYPSWRTFVLTTLDNRFEELLKTVDSIAFSKTDERLMELLIAKSRVLSTQSIHITHQEIANELSSSREVISRLLKTLEQKGKLSLHRNRIELNFAV